MSSVGDGDHLSKPFQPSERAPAVPDDMGWELPIGYKVKRCKFCKCWSTDLCPWPLKNTLLSNWEPLMPWQRGTVKKPVSDECKLCWNDSQYVQEIFFLVFCEVLCYLVVSVVIS